MAESLHIMACGASTPVGRDAWSSAAAVRAGISGFAAHPFMVDTAGSPMQVAVAPWLEITAQGSERFAALLLPAIEQSLEPLADVPAERMRIARSVGLPAERPGLPPELERSLRATIANTFANRFTALATFAAGHAAGLLGLRAAFDKIIEGSFDACVIAGVESYITPRTLEWLEANEQLHGAGPLNNAWGFVPGEGAGAVLLMSGRTAAHLQTEPFARVLAVGTGLERNRIKTQTVCVGEGLTAAFREALAALPPGVKVTDTFCDMNGEPYRADEFGFACLRTKDAFAAASDFVAPADCWGDVSAASGPLGIALSAIAFRKAYAKGRVSFVWASSEGGERAAALLSH